MTSVIIFRAAGGADADRHAGLDRARPDRASTFLFTMTQVPIEAVALKLFHRHRELRDHGRSPFFILGGKFSSPTAASRAA